MKKYRWLLPSLSFALLLSILVGMFSSVSAITPQALTVAPNAAHEGAAPVPGNASSGAKVDPKLVARFNSLPAASQVEYMVVLKDQADTSNKISNADWAEKGWYVYNKLIDEANSTQPQVKSQIDQLKVRGDVAEYHSYWIINSFIVKGNLNSVTALRSNAEISAIKLPGQFEILDDDPTLSPAAQDVVNQALAEQPEDTIQHNIEEVHAPEAWALGYDGAGVTVGSMDSGVRWSHEALTDTYRGNVDPPDPSHIHDYNWFDGFGQYTVPTDEDGHGTHTMGTLVGTAPDNSYGHTGVAPGAEWISVRICGPSGCTPAAIMAGFQWTLAPTRVDGSAANPAYRPRVSSNSWGSTDCTDTEFQTAVTNWVNAGIFPDFANGNEGPGTGTVRAPGSYLNAWGTGNLNTSVANWVVNNDSSRGPSCFNNALKPQAMAPGNSICSSINTSDTAYSCGYTGTSMATPHVAGAIAILAERNPAASIDDIANALTETTFFSSTWGTRPNNNYGYGLIQIDDALSVIGGGGSPIPTRTPTNTPTITPTFTASATATPCPAFGVTNLGDWSNGSSVSGGLYGAAGASDGTYLYTAGGYNSHDTIINNLNRYDPATDTWSSLAAMPDAAYFEAAAVVGGKLYVFGGDTNGSHTLNNTRIYDIASDTWSTGAAMPVAHEAQAAAVIDDRIYLAGGSTNDAFSGATNTFWSYDPATDSWDTSLAQLPTALLGGVAGAVNGHFLVAGGSDASATALDTLYNYDPATDTWSNGPTMLQATYYGGGAAVGNELYVWGGGQLFRAGAANTHTSTLKGQHIEATNMTQVYNINANTWTAGPDLNNPVDAPSSGAVGSMVVSAGGRNDQGVQDTTQLALSSESNNPCATPSATATTTSTAVPSATATVIVTATTTSTPPATATRTTTPTMSATPIITATATGTPGGATETATTTETPCATPFTDIASDVFKGAIEYLYCRGVVNGLDASHYNPGGTSTRAQFAKVVVLGFGIVSYTPANPTFSDVPANYFAYVYVESGYHAGILSGFDQNTCQTLGVAYPCYGPGNPITRGQLTRLVVSAADYPLYTPASGPSFSDVAPGSVFFVSIETAHQKGIISGYPDGTFRPNNDIRRDEMAQIVYKGVTTP